MNFGSRPIPLPLFLRALSNQIEDKVCINKELAYRFRIMDETAFAVWRQNQPLRDRAYFIVIQSDKHEKSTDGDGVTEDASRA